MTLAFSFFSSFIIPSYSVMELIMTKPLLKLYLYRATLSSISSPTQNILTRLFGFPAFSRNIAFSSFPFLVFSMVSSMSDPFPSCFTFNYISACSFSTHNKGQKNTERASTWKSGGKASWTSTLPYFAGVLMT